MSRSMALSQSAMAFTARNLLRMSALDLVLQERRPLGNLGHRPEELEPERLVEAVLDVVERDATVRSGSYVVHGRRHSRERFATLAHDRCDEVQVALASSRIANLRSRAIGST